MSRRSAKYPCQRHERNEQRAVGDAGPYAVRHCRVEHGSGSGSYRRVLEPVIARHPRGAWERLLSPSTGACHSTPPARCAGAAAGRDVQAIRCGTFLYRSRNRTREIQKPLVFGGVLFHISFAVERNMAAGGRNAGRGCSPQSENEQRAVGDAGPYGGIDESTPVLGGAPMRAVGDAGPYAVRHCRAEHGSGSGSYRRVPEPVIARHPCGAWERQRG